MQTTTPRPVLRQLKKLVHQHCIRGSSCRPSLSQALQGGPHAAELGPQLFKQYFTATLVCSAHSHSTPSLSLLITLQAQQQTRQEPTLDIRHSQLLEPISCCYLPQRTTSALEVVNSTACPARPKPCSKALILKRCPQWCQDWPLPC